MPVEELQRFHVRLEAELAIARTQEQESRRQITVASDELDVLKKKHAAEITDLELLKSKADRECRQLKEDVSERTSEGLKKIPQQGEKTASREGLT